MNVKLKSSVMVILLFWVVTGNIHARVPLIHYQMEQDYPPFKFIQDDRIVGFDIDLSNMIFEREHYDVDFSMDAWENVYQRLKRGEIDTCGMLAVTDGRKKDILYSKTVLESYTALYTRKGFQRISLNSLNKLKVAVGKGQYTESLLKEKMGIENYSAYPEVEDAIEALYRGEVDVLFENQQVVNYLLIKKGVNGQIIPQVSNLYPVNIAFGVRDGNPQLVRYINRRLDELMASGAYEQLYQEYFFSHSKHYNEMQKKKLNKYAFFIIISIAAIFLAFSIYIKLLKRKILKEQGLSKSILDSANIFILIWQKDGLLYKFNRYAQFVTGFYEDEVRGRKWMDTFIAKEDIDSVLHIVEELKSGKLPPAHEITVNCKNGSRMDVLWNNSIVYGEDGTPEIAVSMGIDITDRKMAQVKLAENYQELESVYEELSATEEELRAQFNELQVSKDALEISEERYRLAVEGVNDGLWEYDYRTGNMFSSRRCREILGYEEDEVWENIDEWSKLVHPDDEERFKHTYLEHMDGRTSNHIIELRLKTRSSRYKWVLSRSKAMFDSEGKPLRIAGAITDIDDRKKAESIIHNMAYYDALTGLPNRTLLYEKLSHVLDEARESRGMAALMFMDLDNFKSINDTMGHTFGDLLLRNISELLKGCLGQNDFIARLAGDEFVFLLNKVNNIDEIKQAAERVEQIFLRPLLLNNREIFMTASIGIAFYPCHGQDEETLLKNADTAMYHAKETGKNNYKFYTDEMNLLVVRKMSLESSLRYAIKQGEFNVFYQPQIDIKTGELTGAEALIRWHHPTEGYIAPISFIPLAEETGLIVPIGEFVLRSACAQNKDWQKAGYKPIQVSVNLSARQFQQHNLIDTVKAVLDETGLEPKWLSLEITESAALLDYDFTISVLDKLKKMGIEVSLDDFGTGYSSLNYLKRLPIGSLKIDKSFVHDIAMDSGEETIVKAVILMAHSLNLKVIAEGVETIEQFNFLKNKNCDIVQGYLISKAVSAEEFEGILKIIRKDYSDCI